MRMRIDLYLGLHMLLYFRISSFYCFAYNYYDSVISLLDIFNCSLFKFISDTTFHKLVTGHRIISHSIGNVDVISISGKDIIMYITGWCRKLELFVAVLPISLHSCSHLT